MTAYAEMDAAQLNEAIYRKQGYEKLAWPAVPRWQKPGGFGLYDEPQYATDIASAWELVEPLDITVHHHVYSDLGQPNLKWYATIRPEDQLKTVYSYGDTAPLAICRCWLGWKDAQP